MTEAIIEKQEEVIDLQPGKKEFKYVYPKLISRDDPMLKAPMVFTEVEDRKRFARELQASCEMLGGVGLSANQVGIANRIFCVSMGGYTETFFNPVITKYSEETSLFTEGCLSYPGLFIDLKRSKSIMIKFSNADGEEKESMFNGVTARIIQHEYDHMEGTNFVMRASPLKKALAIKKAAKKGFKYNSL